MSSSEKRTERLFPFGTHIYREPSRPLEEIIRDMHIMKKLGFNTIKIQESWCINERREGEINLDKIEILIEEAEKLDLYVCFGVTMEQAPAWLWMKYPDCRLVYSTGEKHEDPTQYLLPADGKPGPCWDHPGAREAGKRFIAEVARRLGRYDNILVWNIWQEVGFWPMRQISGSLGFCYCPYTIARFREWLKEKYNDLDTLNRVWRTGFGDWEEVEPPRIFPMVPSYIDWRYFMDDLYLSRVLQWKAEAFKLNDPKHRPVFCHVSSPSIGSGAEWRWAAQVDGFGSSCYPAWNPFHEWDYGSPALGESAPRELSILYEVEWISMIYDYVRCTTIPPCEYWAAEFQGGPISTSLHLGRVPTPEEIRRWILTALSAGIQGLSFWNHRSEVFWSEAYGFGLLDSIGDSSPRAKEAGRIGERINLYADLFCKRNVPQSEIAILINEDLWHFSQASGNNAASHLSFTIRGIYRILWENGLWTDFVEINEASLNDLRRYKVVILPFPLALDENVFKTLCEYVSSGGVLISEACPGRYDKYGFARPGELISQAREVFSADHLSLQLCHEPTRFPKWTPVERSHGEIRPPTYLSGTGRFSGNSVLASLYVEKYSVHEAEPILLCDREVAGLTNKFGMGKVFLIGTFLGHAYAAFRDKNTKSFFVSLLEDIGVSRSRLGQLSYRERVGENEKAVFLFNMSHKTIVEKIDVSAFSNIEDLLEGEIGISSGKATIKINPFEVRCLILKK
ncbi:MAG: beta-galactosidase [Thermoproteota archaeon]